MQSANGENHGGEFQNVENNFSGYNTENNQQQSASNIADTKNGGGSTNATAEPTIDQVNLDNNSPPYPKKNKWAEKWNAQVNNINPSTASTTGSATPLYNRPKKTFRNALGTPTPSQQGHLFPQLQALISQQTVNTDEYKNFPRSSVPFAIRFLFSHWKEEVLGPNFFIVLKTIEKEILNYIPWFRARPNLGKGYVDCCLMTKDIQTKFPKTPIFIKEADCFIKVVQTREDSDRSIWVHFADLPYTLSDEQIVEQLAKGLKHYGEVGSVTMDNSFTNTQGFLARTAKATLTPHQQVDQNISLIPRIALMENYNRPFRINPETARPMCSRCERLGHVKQFCRNPAAKAHLGYAQAGNKRTHMEAAQVAQVPLWTSPIPLHQPQPSKPPLPTPSVNPVNQNHSTPISHHKKTTPISKETPFITPKKYNKPNKNNIKPTLEQVNSASPSLQRSIHNKFNRTARRMSASEIGTSNNRYIPICEEEMPEVPVETELDENIKFFNKLVEFTRTVDMGEREIWKAKKDQKKNSFINLVDRKKSFSDFMSSQGRDRKKKDKLPCTSRKFVPPSTPVIILNHDTPPPHNPNLSQNQVTDPSPLFFLDPNHFDIGCPNPHLNNPPFLNKTYSQDDAILNHTSETNNSDQQIFKNANPPKQSSGGGDN